MTKFSRRILEECRLRRTAKQKAEFRRRMADLFEDYPVREERFGLLLRRVNLVIGNPDTAERIVSTRLSNGPTRLLPNLTLPKSKFFHYLYRFVLFLLLTLISLAAEDFYFYLTENYLGSLIVYFVITGGALLLWFFGPTFSHHASDNASGVIAAIETLREIPPEDLKAQKIAFVFFDDPPALARGANAFRRRHPQSEEALVVHLDAPGFGDHFLFTCSRELREDQELCDEVIAAIENHPRRSNTVSAAEKCVKNADAHTFPCSVCVSAYARGRLFGILLSFRRRTPRDREIDQTNLELISRFLLKLCEGETHV